MGVRGSGFIPPAHRHRRRRSTTRVRWGPTSRASGTSAPTSTPTSSAATTSRAAVARRVSGPCARRPGLRHGVQELGAQVLSGARSASAASARCCRARRTASLLDPAVTDAWGIPVLKFDYRFGDNELKMVADMADSIEEMFRPQAPRTSRSAASRCPKAGRSTRSARRAWAPIRRPRTRIAWSPAARHRERVPRRRESVRLRRHPEHHVDHSRHVLADDGLREGADAGGEPVTSELQNFRISSPLSRLRPADAAGEILQF